MVHAFSKDAIRCSWQVWHFVTSDGIRRVPGFGGKFSQERAQCSWNMSDNISCDHSPLESLDNFFRQDLPLETNIWNTCFLIGQKFWIAKVQQSRTKVSNKWAKSSKTIKIQSNMHVCPFWITQVRARTEKDAKNPYILAGLSRTYPILIPY